MAKYTNTELMLDGPPEYLGKLELLSKSKSKVVFEDSDSGDTIIYKGVDLEVKKGIIVSGELTGWTYGNAEQDAYTIINGFEIDLDKIDAKNTLAFADKVYTKMLSGKDTMTGSSAADYLNGLDNNDKINGKDGGDYLYGEKGKDTINGGDGEDLIDGGKDNDQLTGGDGLDLFNFRKGDGKDTITDFNANNMDPDHDFIGADYKDVDVSATGNKGQHTLIDFGGGSTITLLNVLSDDVGEFDFYIAP